MAATGVADAHHLHHRHGADGGHDAVVRLGFQRTAGCRPRLCRGRSRQHPGGSDRRISGECQSAAHRDRVGDRRPVATRRPRRCRHRSGVARIRKLAAASCPAGSARRRIVIRRPEDHPCQPDRFDLPAIARRVPADRCDRRRHHHPSDRARGRDCESRSLCCMAYGARPAPGSRCSNGCRARRSGGRPVSTCPARANQTSWSSDSRRRCRFSTPIRSGEI